MVEAQSPGMERLATERNSTQIVRAVRVARFPHQRVAAQACLDADLVTLSRFQPHFNQARRLESLAHPVIADRFCGSRILWMRELLDERLAVPHQVIAPPAR